MSPGTFHFVNIDSPHDIRNHVMREYWRQKKSRSTRSRDKLLAPKSNGKSKTSRRVSRMHEMTSDVSRSLQPYDVPERSSSLVPTSQLSYLWEKNSKWITSESIESLDEVDGQIEDERPVDSSITIAHASENFWGVDVRDDVVTWEISPGSIDPFNSAPFALTRVDQRSLYNWMKQTVLAQTRSPSGVDVVPFHPTRDVWFPLDFSNPASFHGLLAYASYYCSYFAKEKEYPQAISHKIQAIRMVNEWLGDPQKATSDETFAAVIRLLTLERYWGSKQVWRFHRKGLEEMIRARGGMNSFRENWRLEMLLHLTSLMANPSWIYDVDANDDGPAWRQNNSLFKDKSSNERFLAAAAASKTLIPFFESLLTSDFDIDKTEFPLLDNAITLLHPTPLQAATACPSQAGIQETSRLICLLYLVLILQTATFASMKVLHSILARTGPVWYDNIENLRWVLLQAVGSTTKSTATPRATTTDTEIQPGSTGSSIAMKAKQIMEAMSRLSWEDWIGVQSCLLGVLESRNEISARRRIVETFIGDMLSTRGKASDLNI